MASYKKMAPCAPNKINNANKQYLESIALRISAEALLSEMSPFVTTCHCCDSMSKFPKTGEIAKAANNMNWTQVAAGILEHSVRWQPDKNGQRQDTNLKQN